MQKLQDFRENAVRIASGLFIAGHSFKFLGHLLTGTLADYRLLEGATGLGLGASALLLLADGIGAAWGKDNRVFIAQMMGVMTGGCLMTAEMAVNGNDIATLSVGLPLVGHALTLWNASRRQIVGTRQRQSPKQTGANTTFGYAGQQWSKLNDAYPNLVAGVMNISPLVTTTLATMAAGDYVNASTFGAYTIGSVIMSIARPRVKASSNHS